MTEFRPPASGSPAPITPGTDDRVAAHDHDLRSEEGAALVQAEFTPDVLMLPGRLLKLELDARGLTQAELAVRTNLSTKHINQVIKGTASLTFDMALRLERTLGTPAALWNRLEAAHQDQRAREKSRNDWAHNHLGWLRNFPLGVLTDRGVLAPEDSEVTQLDRLLAFFQVADPDAYERTWAEPVAAGFRRTQKTNVDPYATAAWIRLGERAADQTACQPYNATAFAQLLPTLRGLTLLPDREAFAALREKCAAVGVAVELERELPGTRAFGAARWITATKALILLSGRYRFHDIFWFAFFHEAAHLVLHPKRRVVVDLDLPDDTDGQETAANEYAAATLIPDSYTEQLHDGVTARRAEEIADEIGVAPGIVAGRLSHMQNNWTRYSRLRRKLQDITP